MGEEGGGAPKGKAGDEDGRRCEIKVKNGDENGEKSHASVFSRRAREE